MELNEVQELLRMRDELHAGKSIRITGECFGIPFSIDLEWRGDVIVSCILPEPMPEDALRETQGICDFVVGYEPMFFGTSAEFRKAMGGGLG